MSNSIRFLHQHNIITVFVAVSSIAMLVMLLCMRSFVPKKTVFESTESKLLMDQACSSENVQQVGEFLEENEQLMNMLNERFSSNAKLWQRQLHTAHAFGLQDEHGEEFSNQEFHTNDWNEAADYAQDQLNLQSVMKGRTSLANINGSVYKEGETIELRGGALVIELVEVGSSYVVIKPLHGGGDEAIRKIYLEGSSRESSRLVFGN